MKILTITEEQMTYLLKQFLEQYAGIFSHATFDEAPGGYLVHFHQSPERKPAEEETEEEAPRHHEVTPTPTYIPPISVFGNFGSGGGFGGFGGGSSGGGGASSGW